MASNSADVYFISGLGADQAAFAFLKLADFKSIYVDWITPESHETLKQYAIRLKQFHAIPDDATLVGLSFGGMLTTEIAKAFPSIKAILISSIKGRHEMPPSLHFLRRIQFHKWMSPKLHRAIMSHAASYLGIYEKTKIETYKKMTQRGDPKLNQWIGGAILDWDNETVPNNITHIHGTNDNVLPHEYVNANYQVEHGGHLMVMERNIEISDILIKILSATKHHE